MQHTPLILLLSLVASLSACGLPRASDINAPRSSDSLKLDPILPIITASPSESAESEPEETVADESTTEATPTSTVAQVPEGESQDALISECQADEDDDYEDDDEDDDHEDDDAEDDCEDDDAEDDDDDADNAA